MTSSERMPGPSSRILGRPKKPSLVFRFANRKTGIPEEARAYLGMMGFKIHINVHGEVLDVEQPGMIDPDSE